MILEGNNQNFVHWQVPLLADSWKAVSLARCNLYPFVNPSMIDDMTESAYPIKIKIHKLSGYPNRTHSHKSRNSWLEDFLPGSLHGSKIYFSGYETTIRLDKPTLNIEAFAEKLLDKIGCRRGIRRICPNQPDVSVG